MIRSLLTVNNYFGVLQAVLNNLGIGVLPELSWCRTFPIWCRVFPDIESADVPVFLAYPEELRQSKRVVGLQGLRAGRDHHLPQTVAGKS